MDVSASRPPDTIDAAVRRVERTPVAKAAPQRPADRPADRPDPAAPAQSWAPPSSLKFTLSAADVDARFEIHEGTDTVTVTMYERETGEVLRQVPSREVLDVIASLKATGLSVDAIT